MGRAAAFLLICLLGGPVGGTFLAPSAFLPHGDWPQVAVMWSTGVITHLLAQTLLCGLLLGPALCRRPLAFWFAVGAYTSYPLLLEPWFTMPYLFNEATTIWPATAWHGMNPNLNLSTGVATILFYWWWMTLLLVAWRRLPRARRARAVLLVIAVPLLTWGSSYSGCYFGGYAANWLAEGDWGSPWS